MMSKKEEDAETEIDGAHFGVIENTVFTLYNSCGDPVMHAFNVDGASLTEEQMSGVRKLWGCDENAEISIQFREVLL